MRPKSISRKLLTSVLSAYFILTFIVTCGQVIAEYYNSKSHITDELFTLQKTFSGSLTRAIWELNTQQAVTIAEGLLAIPIIEGVIVRDDNGGIIIQQGQVPVIENLYNNQLIADGLTIESSGSGLFGYTFPLIFEFSGRATQVGDVTLISSPNVVIDRILVGIYFLIGNAIVKTTFLIFLFLIAFRKLLTEPLNDLTQQIEELEMDNLEGNKLDVHSERDDELKVMEEAFNKLIFKVCDYKQKLEDTKQQLELTNEKLDKQNLTLEQDVARKTSTLSHAMIDLQQQKYKLEQNQRKLTKEIDLRTKTENELRHKQKELELIVDDLNTAQERLIQSEKFATISGLVAGFTHEVNTPIGIGVTANSYLHERLDALNKQFEEKSLKQKDLEYFIADAQQSSELLTANLNRASQLIESFKQIAVDQASEAVRSINLREYLDEIVRTLYPRLKKTSHKVEISCPDDLHVVIPAGALSQIVTNLIINSIIHGFEYKDTGTIRINVALEDGNVVMNYEDDGKGLDEEQLTKLFDPFFTTRRDDGGTGLGTHITYNLVKQALNGSIQASSPGHKGLIYNIRFPREIIIESPVT